MAELISNSCLPTGAVVTAKEAVQVRRDPSEHTTLGSRGSVLSTHPPPRPPGQRIEPADGVVNEWHPGSAPKSTGPA
eukprot:3980657-Lingulodinium_polyedra.AAC.1